MTRCSAFITFARLVTEAACNEIACGRERRAAVFFAGARRVEYLRATGFVVFLLARFIDSHSPITS
jgi:hypothetical protein